MMKKEIIKRSARVRYLGICLISFFMIFQYACAQEGVQWLSYKGSKGAGQGKKIVLISGDEEYRSEESMPMLAKLLSTHHGFDAVVLFSIDPKTKQVNPEYQKNIPGLEELIDADLMIIATRFRELPDGQMKYIDAYLKAGKPVIGLRTATHAFNYSKESSSVYKDYSFNTVGGDWDGGFGRLVLGETWISHHGDHGKEGTRVLVNGLQEVAGNPLLAGVRDIWVPSDVYGIKDQLSSATILLYGQPTLGMQPASEINWKKSVLPVAWTKPYQLPSGKQGKAFATTMGSSIDFNQADLRRLIINAVYWAVDLEKEITAELPVEVIGTYEPTMFGFGTYKKGTYPKDY